MSPAKFLSVALLCLGLSACFQTNLGGPTGDTTITVSLLRSPGTVLASAKTRTEQFWIEQNGQESWDAEHPLVKLLLVGIMTQNDIPLDLDSIEPSTLYLVTASGGIDRDPQSERAISGNEQVQGIWRAIVTGQRLIDGNIQVSALSEAVYQQITQRLARLTDAGVLSQLDAAARLLVTDIDKSGTVDYGDVLDFSRSLDADKFSGDIADLDALAAAIRANQPSSSLQALSKTVFGSHRVVMSTNFGDLVIDTLNWETPVNADNFLRYVEDGFYDNIIFHRVIDNFVAQAGLWQLQPGTNFVEPLQTRAPVFNESRYSISNQRGTLSMARTSDPNSATSQFFVNQVDNSFLDYDSPDNPDGYTVFATLASGIEVIDTIANIPTVFVNGIGNNVPSEIVLIESATISE